ncbi:spermatogenesis-associated serine-rich protein 1 isoform X2 [Perognathus longimembris pacificus]|uniref:spermatogenesis-associated serine-rich protein 1 isoform X2 n=1 Tax=Perognathus longimembris pacificus TaxID=214514 RepID=UPI002018C740|nr:spermatogenesis-associated serine-rich protein 1 isoform X2 [Perognathus longimembris pacificus]
METQRCGGGLGAEYNDAVGAEGGFADPAPCNGKTSSPSAVETGAGDREPLGLDSVGPDHTTAAGLGGKCCSPSSDHSWENSVPEGRKHPAELSMLGCLTEDGQRPEWTFYPRSSSNVHTYHVGKQCLFNGVFLGNRRSLSERTVDKILGRKKYDIDPRNGIPASNPGDNSYAIPEQSKGFYKAGATLSPVNFAFLPFREKEKANNLKNEIREVEELEYWQPAPTLLQTIFLSGGFTAPSEKTRIKSKGVQKSRVLRGFLQKEGERRPTFSWSGYASYLTVAPWADATARHRGSGTLVDRC